MRSQNTIEKIELIGQETRAKLIQNIIGHRWMMPSKLELDRYNPGLTGGTLTGHLSKLIDQDIVKRVSISRGKRTRSGPSTFYILTDEGYEFLTYHQIFIPIKQEIRQDHAEVRKPERVRQYEQAKRPTVDLSYDHPLNDKSQSNEIVDPVNYADDFDDLDWESSNSTGRVVALPDRN
jgi:DNA-binding HxlR family transcriptional regulator